MGWSSAATGEVEHFKRYAHQVEHLERSEADETQHERSTEALHGPIVFDVFPDLAVAEVGVPFEGDGEGHYDCREYVYASATKENKR